MQVLNLFPEPKPVDFLIWHFDKNNFIILTQLDDGTLDSEAESE